MHVDGAYNRFRAEMPQFRTTIVLPSCCRQASFLSEITPNRWFDRMLVLRKLVAAVRAVKWSRQTKVSQ
jgi:hypothetical protein